MNVYWNINNINYYVEGKLFTFVERFHMAFQTEKLD